MCRWRSTATSIYTAAAIAIRGGGGGGVVRHQDDQSRQKQHHHDPVHQHTHTCEHRKTPEMVDTFIKVIRAIRAIRVIKVIRQPVQREREREREHLMAVTLLSPDAKKALLVVRDVT